MTFLVNLSDLFEGLSDLHFSYQKVTWKELEDDNFPILQVGYVSSLAGTRKTGRNKTNTPWSTNT